MKLTICSKRGATGDIRLIKIKQTKTGETEMLEMKYKKNYQSGKKLSCTGTVKICKVIHHILSPDGKTLKADPSALNKFFDGEIP